LDLAGWFCYIVVLVSHWIRHVRVTWVVMVLPRRTLEAAFRCTFQVLSSEWSYTWSSTAAVSHRIQTSEA